MAAGTSHQNPVPPAPKNDLPLAKAEPTSKSSSTCVITYVRNRKKGLHNSCKRGGEKCETSLQTPISARKEKEWLFKVQIPLQPMMQDTMTQVVPVKPQEDHGAAEIHPTACRKQNARVCTFVLKTAEVYGEPMLQQVLNRN